MEKKWGEFSVTRKAHTFNIYTEGAISKRTFSVKIKGAVNEGVFNKVESSDQSNPESSDQSNSC